jgi:hypothetical protein
MVHSASAAQMRLTFRDVTGGLGAGVLTDDSALSGSFPPARAHLRPVGDFAHLLLYPAPRRRRKMRMP